MFIHVFEVSIPPMLKYIYISLHLYLHDLLFFIHICFNELIDEFIRMFYENLPANLFGNPCVFLFVAFSEIHAFNKKSSWMISVFVPSRLGYRKLPGLLDVLRSHRFSSHLKGSVRKVFLTILVNLFRTCKSGSYIDIF